MPKYSIIVPIYNVEMYLRECIESILNQTFKDFELILINDGSPDNSEQICLEYQNKDKRVKYFSQENQGVAVARNFGIAQAVGEYIFCADSDDTIEKDFIKKINIVLTKKEYDLIVVGKYFSKRDIKRIGTLPTWGMVVKREVLDKYPDVRFQEGFQPCEDGLFTHKLLALVDNIGKCPNAKYNYRENLQSSEHNIDVNKVYKDIPKWLNVLEEFYKKYNNIAKNKIHVLDFIKEEPYSRLCNTDFSDEQCFNLYNIIHDFINRNNLLENNNIQKFDNRFRQFLLPNNYENYKIYRKLANKKILIVENRNLINGQGGVEHVLCNMANVFSNSGASVCVATMDKKRGKPFFELSKNITFSNCYKKIDLIKVFQRIIKKKYEKYIFDLEYKNKLWNKFINKTKPDIIISFSLPTLLEISYKKEYNVPIILTVHGNPINDYTNKITYRDERLNALFKDCYKNADVVQVLLNSYKSTIPDSFKGTVETIANIAPYIDFTIDYDKKEFHKITCVATLNDRKHQDLLINAFAQISDKYPNWTLELYGTGPNKEKYLKLIKKLNIEDKAFLKGSTKQICDKLKQTDIFVLPSLCEGWPLVLGEAMSMGIPCIGLTCCDGTNEVIKHNYSGLLAEDDIQNLAEKIEELILSKDKRKLLEQNAQAEMKNYTEDIIWNKWKTLVAQNMPFNSIWPKSVKKQKTKKLFSISTKYLNYQYKRICISFLGVRIKMKVRYNGK